jgi:hypothetical protein
MDPIRRSTRDALQRCGLEAFKETGMTVVVCRRGDACKLSHQFMQKVLKVPSTKRSACEPLDFIVFLVCSSENSKTPVSMVLIKMTTKFERYCGCAVWLRRDYLTETDIEAAASRLQNG